MTALKSTMPDMSQHKPRSDRWMALAALFLASFMNLIDVSIVNVALPRIQADTGATATQLEWVAAVYVLALAVGLLPFGRFGDVFGRRRMFLWGLSGFTVASVLCGVAPDILTLIAARAAQGSFAALMVPQVLAIVHVIFPPDEKARVFGLFGTVSSIGVVAGPIIGGAVMTADFAGLGWRLAFLINVPLGLVALIGAMRFVPDLETDTRLRPDWIGTGLFAGAIVLLVLPLIEGRVLGWPWWTFAALLACVPMMVGFVLWERRLSKRGLSALMPKGLLENRPYLIRLGLVILFFSGIPGLFLVLAIFLQSGFGLSALQSGLVTTPFPVGVMLASTLTSRFGNAHLTLRIASGAALLTIGMIGLRVVINGVGSDLNPYLFTGPLIICGFGMGTAVMSLFQVTMSSVDAQDAGAGSGAMQAFQQVGAALGIAIAGQIFFSLLGEDGMEGGTEAASRFVHAASQATLYSMAVFAALALGLGSRPWSVSLSQQKDPAMTDTSSNPSQDFWEPHYAKLTRPSGGRVSAVLKQFVAARPIGTALELGCARGDDAIWLAKQGWTVTGVDVAEAALIAARASAQDANVSDRTTFERHDLGMTFPTGKFDLVTAMFFHSPVDFGRVQALRRAAESVAQGGLLLIVAHGSRAPWSWADPDTVYPTAQDELADLAVNADDWRDVFVGPIERAATGPDGQSAVVIDTVIALERR